MATTTRTHQDFNIRGPLSVVPVAPEKVSGTEIYIYILLGPTGSGKSALIQALSPDHELGISKDTLDSVTQDVVCYQAMNLHNNLGTRIMLMDMPGFLDTKLSESRIVKMIIERLNDFCQSAAWVYILGFYFQPITDIRISGSKRGAVKLLRSFAQSFDAGGINVKTTMWNTITTNKQLEDAKDRFDALKDEVYSVRG